MTRTALYRHFDADGALLYVGISNNPFYRLSKHSKTSSWSEEIARIDVEWLGSLEDAQAAERQAIKSEGPKHNLAHAIKDQNPIAWLISHWPLRNDFASSVGAELQAVHKWAQTGRIPSGWQGAALDAAIDLGVDGVDAQWMIDAHDIRLASKGGAA